MDESGGQLDALLVSVGKRLDRISHTTAEPEPVQPLLRRLTCVSFRHAMEPSEVCELVAGSHLRVETPLFGHVAEAEEIVGIDRIAIPCHRAGVGAEETEDRSHRRGLTRPVGTEEAEHASRSYFEAAPVEGMDVTE